MVYYSGETPDCQFRASKSFQADCFSPASRLKAAPGYAIISSSEANTAEALILLGSRRFLCMAFFGGFTSAEKFFSNGADAEFPGEYDTLN